MSRKDETVEFLEEFLLSAEANELEINLTEALEGETENAPRIDSQQKANYFIKVIGARQKEIDEINEVCDEEIAKTTKRVNSFRESRVSSLVNEIEFIKGMLQNYAAHELANSKKKSIKLPYGTIGYKKQQTKWDYNDDELLNWAKKHAPELVKTDIKETVVKNDLKKSVERDGELVKYNNTTVPGITLTDLPDKFNVNVTK